MMLITELYLFIVLTQWLCVSHHTAGELTSRLMLVWFSPGIAEKEPIVGQCLE